MIKGFAALALVLAAPASAQISTSQCYWVGNQLNCTTYNPPPVTPLDTSIPERAGRAATFDMQAYLAAMEARRQREQQQQYVAPPPAYVPPPVYVAPPVAPPAPQAAPPPTAPVPPPALKNPHVRCITCTR